MFLPDILKNLTEKWSISIQFWEFLVVANRPHTTFLWGSQELSS